MAGKDAVKQQLWGLDLDAPVESGAEVAVATGDDKESSEMTRVGKVTSVATTYEGRHIALAYLRSKASDGQRRDWQGEWLASRRVFNLKSNPPGCCAVVMLVIDKDALLLVVAMHVEVRDMWCVACIVRCCPLWVWETS